MLVLVSCGGGGDTTPTTPPAPSVTGISVSPSTVALSGLGATSALSATLTPTGIAASITWSSDNPAIASVIGSGATATVTAVSGGTTRIVARTGSLESSSTVTSTPLLRRITLPTDTVRLLASATQTLSPTLDADAGANTAVTWTTSAPNVASVSASGVVTGVALGVAVITATSVAFPSLTASIPVRVSYPTVAIAITPANPTVLTGATRQLTATVTAGAGVATTVEWGTTAPLIATVNAAGVVTAVSRGAATITATSTANPTVSTTTQITVNDPTVRAITVAPIAASVFAGSTKQLNATIDADAGANTALQWSTSNAAVATVSSSGLVTGVVNGGPVIITARSSLVNTVTATATITVTDPPPATNYTVQRIGVAPYLGGYGPISLRNFNATDALVAVGVQGAGLGSFANRFLQRVGGVLTDLTPAGYENAGLSFAVAGASATDALVTFSGDQFTAVKPPKVFRLLGSTMTDAGWPLAEANAYVAPDYLARVSTGEYIATTPSGRVYRYSAGVWTKVDSLQGGSGNTANGTVAWARDSVIAYYCGVGDVPTVSRWLNGTHSTMTPSPTMCRPGNRFAPLLGWRSDSLLTFAETNAAVWNGAAWRVIPLGTVTDSISAMADCNGVRYAAGRRGSIYMQSGNSFTRIAQDGDAVAISEFSRTVALSCAADGTLRVLSGGALLVRRSAGAWVEENFAPSLTAVTLASPSLGYAAGQGVIYRWNGNRWDLLRRSVEIGESFAAVATSSDGTFIGVGTTRSPSGAVLVRGAGLTSTALPQYVDIKGLAPIGNGDALSIARPSIGSEFQLVRISGNTASLAAGFSGEPIAVASSGATNAIVLRKDGSGARYDGAAWTNITGVGTIASQFISSMVTFGSTSAFASECRSASGGGIIWRYNGTNWQTTTLPPLGNVTCVRSVYGSGPSDVFAVVEADAVGRVLHWDGNAWSTLGVTVTDARAGAAVVGLSAIVGFRGFGAIGLPPAGFRGIR